MKQTRKQLNSNFKIDLSYGNLILMHFFTENAFSFNVLLTIKFCYLINYNINYKEKDQERFLQSLIYNVLFVSCFLLLLLSFYFFMHSFIDNYVSCHVFLVSSGVRQLLFRVTEMKQYARDKSKKQETKST